MTRQPDFSTRPRPSRAPIWERAAIGLSVLALASVLTAAWGARSEAEQARARLAAVQGEVDRYEARVGPRRPGGEAPVAAGTAPPTAIVAALASALPATVRVDQLAVDYAARVSVELGVVARDAAAWDRLIEQLERSPRFQEVAPGPESREAEIHSVVRARYLGAQP